MVDTCAVFERRVRRDVCGDDGVKGKRQSRSRANRVNQIDSFATVFAISNDDPDGNGWVLASEVAEA
jgi:hypothetical protein